MASIDDYVGLITSEHSDKPKFTGAIAATAQPFVDAINVLGGMAEAFDLDFAIGAQLDIIGEWVGVTRWFTAPLIGVYFSFDTADVGWDHGYWQGPFDPDFGLERLDDPHYLTLLRAKIASNHWDGTAAEAHAVLEVAFPDNYVYVADNQDMTLTVAVIGPPLGAVNKALLTGGYLSLKPATVAIDAYLTTSEPDAQMFGFDVENQLLSGYDGGNWAIPL